MITDLTRRYELNIDATPARFGQVRRIVQAQLRYWRLAPLVDPVGLGITELLANVHQHAHPDKRCTLKMTYRRGALRVAVQDADPRLPVMAVADPMGTCGRGLAIIAALSGDWGVQREEDGGKTVWFTLSAGRATVERSTAQTPDDPATSPAPAPPDVAAPMTGHPMDSLLTIQPAQAPLAV